MSKDNNEWNEKSLIAWNQWKEICSICKCEPKYRRLLTIEVGRAFKKKLQHCGFGDQLDSSSNANYNQNQYDNNDDDDGSFVEQYEPKPDNPTTQSDAPDDPELEEDFEESDEDLDVSLNNSQFSNWAHEFDFGIIEKADFKTKPLNYKDHTWEKIKQSDDPPLKIIRGNLIGCRGIINEIVERYLRVNYPTAWDNYKARKNKEFKEGDDARRNKIDSLQDHIPGDEEITIEDIISAPKSPVLLDEDDKKCLKRNFLNLFTNDNAAIFLIYLTEYSEMFVNKIAMSAPELLKYVGLSKSAVYDRLNNIIIPQLKKPSTECGRSFETQGAINFLIFLLIKQIRPEKRASSLLQLIVREMKHL